MAVGAVALLGLGVPASGTGGGDASTIPLLQAPARTTVGWSGSGVAPCPEGNTRQAQLHVEGFNAIPQSQFNNGWYTASSPTGLAARSDVSSSDPSDHMFLPYVKGTSGTRTMLGFASRSNQSDSAYTRAQVNSVDLRVGNSTGWQGKVYDITAATDDEGGQLGTWFEHKAKSGASAWWYVDNLQIFTCRSAPVTRVSGPNRYDSAAKIAATYPAGVDVAYLATGENFPDAIAASALAGEQDAPILLARPGQLPASTAAQLDRLNPGELIVLGGTAALSDTVARQAGSYAGSWRRVTGGNRYDVSAALTQAYSPGESVLYVASGDNFPDALTIGALAARQGAPLLLTPKSGLDPAIEEQVARLDPGRIVVVGGTAAVSDTVVGQLRPHTSGSVTRITGANRYAVSSAIAQQFPSGGARAYVATGLNFPDALVGGARAGSEGVPVVLSGPTTLHPEAAEALRALDAQRGVLLGGAAALSSLVMDQVGALVG